MKNSRSNYKIVQRAGAEDLTVAATQGLYNQPLFDLCADDALLAFSLTNSYNPALDVIGFETSNVHLIKRQMLTYIAASGAAAGSASVSDHSDPCAPGNGTEFGTCGYELEGWGRLRRSSDTRDITDVIIKYCEKEPILDIAGNKIDDDYEWDAVRLMTVMLQDFQRRFIDGNKTVAGQHDGLEQIITYGYTDPDTDEVCSTMDSTVIDYGENAMCPEGGAEGVTYNGDAVADGYDIYDFFASFLRRTRQRIAMSSLSGQATHIGLIPTEHLNCLIECWVCNTHCGGDQGQMMESEVQAVLNRLKSQLADDNSVVLSFHGVPIRFFMYDYALNSTGDLADIYVLTPTVGNTPLLRIQVKDMNAVASHPAMAANEMRVTDNGRILTWTTVDHTCYRLHEEMQWRLFSPAPWAHMRIIDVSCVSIFGHISSDPLSPFYPESNLVASRRAINFTPYVAPQAVNDFYTRIVGAADLAVAAGTGLLANDVLGYPAATATVVTNAATVEGGQIDILATGAINYTPPSATFEGVDTYVYTISNAEGSDTATVTIVSHAEVA